MRVSIYFVSATILLLVITLANEAGIGPLQAGGENIYFSGEIVGPQETVPNAPYTATAIIENTQVLTDGNRIVHKATQLVARDSKGRIRREQTIDAIGSIRVSGPKVIFIIDPVAQRQYVLNTRDKTAEVKKLPNFRIRETRPAQERNGKKNSNEGENPEQTQAAMRRLVTDVVQESLGSKVMEGVNVKGEINKWTLPAGTIGNEHPIAISVETWLSPELQITVLRHRIDPRFGDVMYRLTEIQRTEPDRSLFKIPPGYKITYMR
jgi:hypothetical protein